MTWIWITLSFLLRLYLFIEDFVIKTDFSQKKGLFYDVTSIFLNWVYACTLGALTPHPPSRVLMFDHPLFHSFLTQIQTPSDEDLNRWPEPKMLHTNWSGVCHVTKCCALIGYRLYRRLLLLYWTPSDWRPSLQEVSNIHCPFWGIFWRFLFHICKTYDTESSKA